MKQSPEKLARIRAVLDECVPEPPVPLDHVDPFTLLVAVVLSAQTTDKKVNEVTPALFARARTPEAMAKLPVEEVLGFIRQVGLAPGKAKALVGLSKLLVEKHGGKVPRTLEELVELPGVGRKTASVVLVQAFGIPAFPVDTHIHRLATRWGLTSGKSVEETERDLRALFPPESWGRLHLQLIWFGRQFCPAQRHDPATCPICSFAARPAGKAAAPRAPRKDAARPRRTSRR